MQGDPAVKPYLVRIKDWKVKNMVQNYLEARTLFKRCQRKLRKGNSISFAEMKDIGDILYEVKEDHHLLYTRAPDSSRRKYNHVQKFKPSRTEIDFMNNVGLLFHKILVVRELKYVMEHYVEESDTFQRNEDSLRQNLTKIDELFDEGIDVLKSFILDHADNILLLTLLLDDPEHTKKHFGQSTAQIVEQFGNGGGLAEIYYHAGKYYVTCGRPDSAKRMFKSALRKNPQHKKSMVYLRRLR